MNTLVIPDLHQPFTHRDFLEFCKETEKRYKCQRVVSTGDIVDCHSTSFHKPDPSGMSAGAELEASIIELRPWKKAFPRMDIAWGNHDAIIRRKAHEHGLPKAYFKSFSEAYELPKAWRFDWEFTYGNWRLRHGTGTSGHDAAFKQAIGGRISTVQGHLHSSAGVKYHASSKDILWGMQVGCGIDRKSYAFAYGRDFKDKPILGCGVVLDNGRVPLFEPMPL